MSINLNGPALEVAIGLAFVFFLLSLIVSAGTEAVAWALKWRAKTLVKGIHRLLGDEETAEAIVRHPLVQSDVTTPADKRPPSYVSPRNFSQAMVEILDESGTRSTEGRPRAERVGAGIDRIRGRSPVLATQLQVLYDENAESYGGPPGFRKAIEKWFEDGMDRVSGWYKRWSQLVACLIALAVAIGLNVDAIRVAERLVEEPAVRARVVAQAEAAAQTPAETGKGEASEASLVEAGETAEGSFQKLDALELPILWSGANDAVSLATVVGWLITAIAISLGAPFWFDALGKLAHLKTTGKKPAAAT